jgi:hypothetical protein
MALPDTGQLSYGNVVFDCLYSSKMSGKMEMDRANRGVKYTAMTLDVTAHVTVNKQTSLDTTFPPMRETLSAPGQVLKWTGKGFGPFTVNGGLGFVDVAWGPKPELLDFKPLGGALSALVHWRVTVRIKECVTAAASGSGRTSTAPSKLLAFTWNTSLGRDDKGYTTWSVNGELEIAQTYNNTQAIDQWRSMTEPFLPIGFRTTRASRKISDDKRTIVFDYTYQEMPPMGVPITAMKAEGSYSVRAVEQGKTFNPMNRFQHHLRATYVIRPDAPRREAYLRFVGLMQGRMKSLEFAISPLTPGNVPSSQILTNQILQNASSTLPGVAPVFGTVPGVPAPPGALPIPPSNLQSNQVVGDRIEFFIRNWGLEEGVYLNSDIITFEASWIILCRWSSILVGSGVWRKVQDCVPTVWKSWMNDVQGADNWAHYYTNTANDAVIDVCNRIPPPVSSPSLAYRVTGQNLATGPSNVLSNLQNQGLFGSWKDPDSGQSPDSGITLDTLLAPEVSWLNYQCWFETELDPGTALLKSLPQASYPIDTLSSVDAYATTAQSAKGSVNLTSQSKQADNVVRVTTSTYKVTLKGYGVRVGYDIPVPGLVSWAGVKPVPGKQWDSGPQIIDQYCGIPVYLVAWKLEYFVPVPPAVPAGQRQFAPPNLGAMIADTNTPSAKVQIPISAIETAPQQLGTIIGTPNPAR